MAKYEYSNYKIIIDPESRKTQGLRVGTSDTNYTTYSVEAHNKSTADMTGGSFASTISSDFKEDYTAPNQVNNGYPILSWQ